MHILIDGYNLMHAAGLMRPRFGPGGLEKARRALIGVLAGSLAEDATQTTVVFDARLSPRSQGERDLHPPHIHGIRVEFAVGEESADARIEHLIRLDSAPKQLRVVSSDARIRAAAKRRGAKPIDSDTFWHQITSHRRTQNPRPASSCDEKPGRSTPRDVDFWIKEFADLIREEDLRNLASPFEENDSLS